ncbi:MAG: hypothetical protein OQK32_08310 [Gammaproteobacteria bacterium]|nr:hypothetical protein [Gammaproteobacteria bacterium]MCW8923307.1 hypothetical protein [Gammaproteobacteria bacterium]
MDIYSGHFSREANNGPTAEKTNNNIYIKFYPNEWIALLYVPYPYGKNVSPDTIDQVFAKVKRESETGSFTRSKYDLLDEAATAHVEKYEIVEGQIQFQCGSLNPCAIRRYNEDNYIELVKSGIINEHIIKFDHITE